MTLIVGLNLSDKLYLAADTRVTRYNFDRSSRIFIDNIIKIKPIFGKNILDQDCGSKNMISVAVAGDVRLAAFVCSKIESAIYRGSLSQDIRELFSNLNEEYFTQLANSWLTNGGEYGVSCCLMFAGNESGRNKKISLPKLRKLVELYKQDHVMNPNKREEINGLITKDTIMKKINTKLKNEAGKDALQLLIESSIPKVPVHIEEALVNNIEDIKSMSDSLIFAVEFKLSKEGIMLSKLKAEWGQFLARGAGLSEGDLAESLLSTLELMPGKEKSQEHLMEGAIISTEILGIAREKEIKTIGGTVVINCLKREESQIMGKDNSIVGGCLSLNLYNQIIPTVVFTKFSEMLSDKMSAEL